MLKKIIQSYKNRELSITAHLINFSILIIVPLIVINSLSFYFYYEFSRLQLERRVTDHAEIMRKILNNQLSTIVRFISDKKLCDLSNTDLQQLQWTLNYGLQIEQVSVLYYNKNNKLIYQHGSLGGRTPSFRDRSQDFSGQLESGEHYQISNLLQDDQGNFYNQLTIFPNCSGMNNEILSINIPPSYWQSSMHSLESIPGVRVSILDTNGRFIISALPGSQGKIFNEGESFKLNPKKVSLKTGVDWSCPLELVRLES